MKKILFLLFLVTISISTKAQYSSLDTILTLLEEKKGINKNLKNVSIDDKKFLLVRDFDDRTERNFIIIKGDKTTYVEIIDNKQTGESTSKVFSGDNVRSNKNIISLRCDLLEGEKIPIPVTKTFLLTQQKDILYLVDTNNRERWIDEKSFGKSSKK